MLTRLSEKFADLSLQFIATASYKHFIMEIYILLYSLPIKDHRVWFYTSILANRKNSLFFQNNGKLYVAQPDKISDNYDHN